MRKFYTGLLTISWLLLLIGCASGPATPQPVQSEATTEPEAVIQDDSSNKNDVSTNPDAPLPNIGIRLVASQFIEPNYVTHAGDGSARLFVTERQGKIWVVENGRRLAEPFLDLAEIINFHGLEQGLLGVAFHPDFAIDRRFFIHYTEANDDVVIASYQTTPDLQQVDQSSRQEILRVSQPFFNHNGGQILFGPDGYLYIGLGDGGYGENVPANSLLSKILRLDVDSGEPYRVPDDNPFVNNADFPDEVWAVGVRNPWRFSFDRLTDDFYLADVGENLYEEINIQSFSQAAIGLNYGWPVVEATHCYKSETCSMEGVTLPVTEYEHGPLGCAVSGGYVYRGQAFADLQGVYLYGDFCTGIIWGLRAGGEAAELLDTILNISSFGEDEAGELYVVDFTQGNIYQIIVPSDEQQTNWPGGWPLATELQTSLDAEFEGGIRLLGYAADQALGQPGSLTHLTLFWQGQSLPEASTVFVQVRNEANENVTQADHPLFVSPMMLVADNTILRDGASVALPPDLASGTYRVLVGFYNPETDQRLPVVGDQTGENAVILAEFNVE